MTTAEALKQIQGLATDAHLLPEKQRRVVLAGDRRGVLQVR